QHGKKRPQHEGWAAHGGEGEDRKANQAHHCRSAVMSEEKKQAARAPNRNSRRQQDRLHF
ncbi:MAG TPA: hypothetical protein VL986_02280, partial [Terracidiphilus sp.]|nr:hypothetical protein [Terracidiphilus sp.]